MVGRVHHLQRGSPSKTRWASASRPEGHTRPLPAPSPSEAGRTPGGSHCQNQPEEGLAHCGSVLQPGWSRILPGL